MKTPRFHLQANTPENVEIALKWMIENLTGVHLKPSIVCPPDVFHKIIRNLKRILKRAWREQRTVLYPRISKSDWLVTKGVRKEWQ